MGSSDSERKIPAVRQQAYVKALMITVKGHVLPGRMPLRRFRSSSFFGRFLSGLTI